MDKEVELRRSDTFVLRVLVDGPEVAGQVEHVRTGAKRRFQGLEELGRVLEHLGRQDEPR